ncbi:hypothetical protein AQF52_8086 [Streptomyces venezuelae]|nr:hypothetical protein AQF52_0019 [Streptomyces venezuelae]ALO13667.1 hypothetical protein AQF52_8086 [Streptomyces venezuelae]
MGTNHQLKALIDEFGLPTTALPEHCLALAETGWNHAQGLVGQQIEACSPSPNAHALAKTGQPRRALADVQLAETALAAEPGTRCRSGRWCGARRRPASTPVRRRSSRRSATARTPPTRTRPPQRAAPGPTYARIIALDLVAQAEQGSIERACGTWCRAIDTMAGVKSPRPSRRPLPALRPAPVPGPRRTGRGRARRTRPRLPRPPPRRAPARRHHRHLTPAEKPRSPPASHPMRPGGTSCRRSPGRAGTRTSGCRGLPSSQPASQPSRHRNPKSRAPGRTGSTRHILRARLTAAEHAATSTDTEPLEHTVHHQRGRLPRGQDPGRASRLPAPPRPCGPCRHGDTPGRVTSWPTSPGRTASPPARLRRRHPGQPTRPASSPPGRSGAQPPAAPVPASCSPPSPAPSVVVVPTRASKPRRRGVQRRP